MVAVAAALNGNLEKAGGRDYIAELAGTVRAPGHARHHAALIRAKADERGARQIGHGLTNGLAPEEAMERLRALRERSGTAEDWLGGEPMDPTLADGEPLPPLAGFPFLHAGAGAVISGPTGGGRSSLLQAGAYDAACAGLRIAYLGSEVTPPEFNARAADLAERRGHEL